MAPMDRLGQLATAVQKSGQGLFPLWARLEPRRWCQRVSCMRPWIEGKGLACRELCISKAVYIQSKADIVNFIKIKNICMAKILCMKLIGTLLDLRKTAFPVRCQGIICSALGVYLAGHFQTSQGEWNSHVMWTHEFIILRNCISDIFGELWLHG